MSLFLQFLPKLISNILQNKFTREDPFNNLPPEIIIEILTRLPFRSIASLRCVCKSWLSLTETHEFVEFYFQKSSFRGGLALFKDEMSSRPLKFLEFVDEGNSAHSCRVVLSISFPTPLLDLIIKSSVNGLLFLFNRNRSPLFICNPITREYIQLPPPNEASSLVTYGFGESKLTGQYKVVRLFRQYPKSPFKFEVYTVGTGSWRSIAAHVPLHASIGEGVFFNGNLHWMARDSGRILWFDLETERFSTFSTPALVDDPGRICSLGDSFYLYKSSCWGTGIWLMNEYGDDKSWRMEHEIYNLYRSVVPNKVTRDWVISLANDYRFKMYYYSGRLKLFERLIYLDGFAAE